MSGRIRLRGITGATKGQCWESAELLRIGRLETLEVQLDDASVSRYHAEVRATPRGWRIRDLGSTNGTRLNGVRLNSGQWPLRQRDLLQLGDVAVSVDELEDPKLEESPAPPPTTTIEATARFSWDEALEGLAYDSNRCPRPGEQLLALIRAGHRLGNEASEDQLLKAVLNDAVAVLDAQRGAIALADGPGGTLRLRAAATGRVEPRSAAAGRDSGVRPCFSLSLAQRSLNRGASRKGPSTARYVCYCEHLDNVWACCTWIVGRGKNRSTGTTCIWPTPWPYTYRRELKAHSCYASSAISFSTRSTSWPRRSRCATSIRAAIRLGSRIIRCSSLNS
jgi:hypothetical protein